VPILLEKLLVVRVDVQNDYENDHRSGQVLASFRKIIQLVEKI